MPTQDDDDMAMCQNAVRAYLHTKNAIGVVFQGIPEAQFSRLKEIMVTTYPNVPVYYLAETELKENTCSK